MSDAIFFRKYLNIINEAIQGTEVDGSKTNTTPTTQSSASSSTGTTPTTQSSASSSTSVTPTTEPVTNKPESKPAPGGYTGKGVFRNNAILTNPELWDYHDTPEAKKARDKWDKKYAGRLVVEVPDDLRKKAGYHDNLPGKIDAPWRYSGDGTIVQLPNGTVASGSYHKGFLDPKAPPDVLPVPSLETMDSAKSIGAAGAVATFLVKTGHDDASIARSLKYYFPKLSDKSIATEIYSANDSARAGYNTGIKMTVDSPHDHSVHVLGPVQHPGAKSMIDPDVHKIASQLMYDLGRDPKEGPASIKSAYKTRTGANVAHTYDEIDPKLFDKTSYQYPMSNEYKVGDFLVTEIPETDDNGKPTGRKIVYATRFGKYKIGKETKVNNVSSMWHGTPAQWRRDNKEFLDQLKKTESFNFLPPMK